MVDKIDKNLINYRFCYKITYDDNFVPIVMSTGIEKSQGNSFPNQ